MIIIMITIRNFLLLKDNTFGTNFFFLPSENQKIEVNLASLNEYRYGGEMVSGAHFSKAEKGFMMLCWEI